MDDNQGEITTFCVRADGTRMRAMTIDGCRVTIEAPDGDDQQGRDTARRIAVAMGVLPRSKPFMPTRVRKLASGRLFVANHSDRGLESFGYEFGSWRDLFCTFDVHPTSVGEDNYGPYVEVSP